MAFRAPPNFPRGLRTSHSLDLTWEPCGVSATSGTTKVAEVFCRKVQGRMLKFSSMTLTYPPWKLLVTYPLEKMMVGRWNFLLKLVPFQGDIHAIVFFSSFWVIVIFCLCLCLSFAYPNRCYVDLYDTHTHTCVKGSLVGKLPSYGLLKKWGRMRKKRHGKEE